MYAHVSLSLTVNVLHLLNFILILVLFPGISKAFFFFSPAYLPSKVICFISVREHLAENDIKLSQMNLSKEMRCDLILSV